VNAPTLDALEAALRAVGPAKWDAREIRDCATELVDSLPDWDDEDRVDLIADTLWTMGAGGDHARCRYRDGDFDADYANECATCRRRLEAMGVRLVTALTAADGVTER